MTGVPIVYVAAVPARSSELVVSGTAELAEIKWASLAVVDELTGDVFELERPSQPVRPEYSIP